MAYMWMFEGKCANDEQLLEWTRRTKEDFFHDAKWVSRAEAYCEDCPVRQLCLDHAMVMDLAAPVADQTFGVMGGKSRRARNALRKKAAKKDAAVLLKIEEFQRRSKALLLVPSNPNEVSGDDHTLPEALSS